MPTHSGIGQFLLLSQLLDCNIENWPFSRTYILLNTDKITVNMDPISEAEVRVVVKQVKSEKVSHRIVQTTTSKHGL